MMFVIVDRFGNLWGTFDEATAAARWAISKFGDGENDWQCVPLRAPDLALTTAQRLEGK